MELDIARKARKVRAALTRLIGTPRNVNHGKSWRLPIVAGGQRHSIHIQIPDRDDLGSGYESYLAEQLFVTVAELDDVLENWDHDQLVKHLEQQPPEELKRRVFGIK